LSDRNIFCTGTLKGGRTTAESNSRGAFPVLNNRSTEIKNRFTDKDEIVLKSKRNGYLRGKKCKSLVSGHDSMSDYLAQARNFVGSASEFE